MRRIVVSSFAILMIAAACGMHTAGGSAMAGPEDAADGAARMEQRSAQIEAVQRALAGQTDETAAKQDRQAGYEIARR